jgi:hypothetical protein
LQEALDLKDLSTPYKEVIKKCMTGEQSYFKEKRKLKIKIA